MTCVEQCRSYSLIVGLEAVVESEASHTGQTSLQNVTAAKTLSIVKLLVNVVYGGSICRLIHLGTRQQYPDNTVSRSSFL